MNLIRITGTLILLSLSSCLTILQPLVTYDSITTDDRLDGSWIGENSQVILMQRFMNSKYGDLFKEKDFKYTKEDSIFYTKFYVIHFSENNLDYTWIANLCKINGDYYANLLPDGCLNEKGKDAYKIEGTEGVEYLATSSIAKLKWKDKNSLTLHFLNGDHIKEIILNDRARLRHEYDPLFDNFLITASSGELQEFLKKYGSSEKLFVGGRTIVLNRKN